MKSFQNTSNYILSLYADTDNKFSIFITNSGILKVNSYKDTDLIIEASSTIVNKDEWLNVSLSWENGIFKIIINNNLESSTSFIGDLYDSSLLSNDFRVGGLSTISTTDMGNMEFKNFRTYNFALTEAEIKLLQGGN
jgi:hypothetical protein